MFAGCIGQFDHKQVASTDSRVPWSVMAFSLMSRGVSEHKGDQSLRLRDAAGACGGLPQAVRAFPVFFADHGGVAVSFLSSYH